MEPMRPLTTVLLFALAPLFAQTSEEKDAVAAVQKTFNAMAARYAAMIRSTMLPDARLYSVRSDGAPAGTAIEDFVTRITPPKRIF
jgi:hypothetical protein